MVVESPRVSVDGAIQPIVRNKMHQPNHCIPQTYPQPSLRQVKKLLDEGQFSSSGTCQIRDRVDRSSLGL